MKLSDYKALFISETEEILQALESGVLNLENDEDRSACINELFRHAHNLKGMSGAMGYDSLVEGSHSLENILDRFRRGEIDVSSSKADLLLSAVDHLRRLVQCVVDESDGDAEKDILGELFVILSPMCEMPAAPGGELAPDGEGTVGSSGRAGSEGGAVTGDAEMEQDAGEEKTDDSAMKPDAVAAATGDSDEGSVGDDGSDGGHDETGSTGRGAVVSEICHHKILSTRVELERLDRLMDLVGELIISRIRLNGIARELGSKPLLDNLASTGRLISEIQKEVMESRLVPVGQVYQRFKRLVRDVSREMGKEVRLEVIGSEIGLDKTVLEGMVDPLVHLIRNAMDHGIETPDEREAAGKPVEGKLTLSARRERNFVILEVSDDGRGINAERVFEKGRLKKLTKSDESKTREDELCSILTAPGFSTSTKVDIYSGRGMGMNIVKNMVDAMGGTMHIKSGIGKGTSVSLKLPINLSIIKALLFHVGDDVHALPIEYVKETTRVERGSFAKVRGKDVIQSEKGAIPVVRPWEIFGFTPDKEDTRFIKIVIVETGHSSIGLVVHRIVGQQDIVIKALPPIMKGAGGISGATILGSGKIAFIWDPKVFTEGRCIHDADRETVVFTH
jgi:two-component system chemotaxis sensor kinase CheA